MSTNAPQMKKTNFGKMLSLAIGMVIGGALTGFVAYLVIRSGHTYAEMDWNNDKETSLSETLHSLDVGVRSVEVNGCPCRYFFEYKDGRPIKTLCDGKAVILNPTLPIWAQ